MKDKQRPRQGRLESQIAEYCCDRTYGATSLAYICRVTPAPMCRARRLSEQCESTAMSTRESMLNVNDSRDGHVNSPALINKEAAHSII